MKRLATTLLALTALAAPAWANHDLIISEYVEGTSFNKAIEIYNPTAGPIDMTAGGYSIRHYFNGAVAPTNVIALTGIIPAGDVWVVVNTQAGAALLGLADQTNGNLNFNGDDAVELVKGAGPTVVDVIGQIGFDPGTEWGAALISTADNTIRRKSDVCEGDTNGADVFDPSIQWDGFATDTFDGIGTHVSTCQPTPTSNPTWGKLKALYR